MILCTIGTDGAEVIDDFEWLVPVNAPPSTVSQYPEDIVVDRVTGDIYVIWSDSYPYRYATKPRTIFCSRYDPDIMELELISSHTYLGYYGSHRFDLVHDGRWYYFYQTEDYKLHLRVDDERIDRLNWTFHNEIYNQYLMRALLGVHQGRVYFVVADDVMNTKGYELYSFNLTSFLWKKVPLFDLHPSHQWTRFLMKDGVIYCIQDRYKTYSDDHIYELFAYDLESLERTGPTHLFTVDQSQSVGLYYGVDSDGNLHLLTGHCVLDKYSPAGKKLGTTQIPKLPAYEDAHWDERRIIINRTDYIYVLATLRVNRSDTDYVISYVFSKDYGSRPIHHNISKKAGSSADLYPTINSSDRVFLLFFEQVEDHRLLALTMQIDTCPDLTIVADSFQLEELSDSKDPVRLSLRVDNVGRASSRSYWMSICRRPAGGRFFYDVDAVLMEVPIGPGGHYEFVYRVTLPKGNCQLRLEVLAVVPFENHRDNNAIEVMVYTRVNNPPVVAVETPFEGETVREALFLSGRTLDIDGDEGITTHVRGPLDIEIKLSGMGDWNATIDLSHVPSGDYLVTFQATDGTDHSHPVSRHVRVDHINESLWLDTLSPDGDVELLVGEDQLLRFSVVERFGRPILYEWTLDEVSSGLNSTYYSYHAWRSGTFKVEVSASNRLTSLSRTWNITARMPVEPGFSALRPEGAVVAGKHEEVEFSVEVLNPDDQQYTLLWFSDDKPLDLGSMETAKIGFDISGSHSVAVTLVSWLGADSHMWIVHVTNKPPLMTGWSPFEPVVPLEGPETMDFSVEAEDPDGDELDYSWHLVNLTESRADGRNITIEFEGGMDYEVAVRVTDGEEWATVVWKVVSPETEEPTVEPDVGWSFSPVLALLMFLVMSIIAVAVGYYLQTGHMGTERNGEGKG